MILKKRLFKFPRYWYHLSNTLKDSIVHLIPKDDSPNRSWEEPPGARICVAPTIEQCLLAIVYVGWEEFNIYRTKHKIIPTKPPPKSVFDSALTDEGWLEIPTTFVKCGTLNLDQYNEYLGKKDSHIISNAASQDNLEYCREVLTWWNRRRATYRKFIEPA